MARDLFLALKQGQLLCILGTSECKKTTTLSVMKGSPGPNSGSMRLDGEDITRISSGQRPVTTVFQFYGLSPHMTVPQNVTYGLKFRGVEREQAQQKGMRYPEMVGLADYARAYIQEISRGQQQRVVLARALIAGPKLRPLDEPFCDLGTALRTKIHYKPKRLQKALGLAMVFVTYDQEEVTILVDCTVTTDQDELAQSNAPPEPCRRPAGPLAAKFMDLENLV